MSKQSFIEKLTESDDGMRTFQQERAIVEATELVCQIMEDEDVSRSELADRMNKTRGYITQLLDGSSNLTIRTLSDALFALKRTLHFQDGQLDPSRVMKPILRFSQSAEYEPWRNIDYPKVEQSGSVSAGRLAG